MDGTLGNKLLSVCLVCVQALLSRAKTLQHADTQAVQASKSSSASPNRLTLPVQQLGQLKRSVEVQEEGIIACQQKLALLQSALGDVC